MRAGRAGPGRAPGQEAAAYLRSRPQLLGVASRRLAALTLPAAAAAPIRARAGAPTGGGEGGAGGGGELRVPLSPAPQPAPPTAPPSLFLFLCNPNLDSRSSSYPVPPTRPLTLSCFPTQPPKKGIRVLTLRPKTPQKIWVSESPHSFHPLLCFALPHQC